MRRREIPASSKRWVLSQERSRQLPSDPLANVCKTLIINLCKKTTPAAEASASAANAERHLLADAGFALFVLGRNVLHTDVRADGTQLFHQIFIAALDILNVG